MSVHRPFVLVILDGWGQSSERFGNAIAAARTPAIDALVRAWPSTTVAASGEAVGLPEGQQGNSEVGHLTIGAGRVIYQPLTRINRAVRDGSFYDNEALCGAVDGALERGTALHCMGLLSPGGVHSEQAHGVAVARLAHRRGLDRVYFHAFTDGRDEAPTMGAGFVRRFIDDLAEVGCGRIVTVGGRYWAMDRDTRWDRVQRAYEEMAGESVATTSDAVSYIESQYAQDVTDEFVAPASVVPPGGERVRIEDGDAVVFFNFRPDRGRQLTHALVDRDFAGFQRSRVVGDLQMVTFAEYDRSLPVAVAFPREDVSHTLAEEVSAAGLRQFHVAETEKYAHVTYFINGGREDPFTGEDRSLVPSVRVATYDLSPAMSAEGVADAVVGRLECGGDALLVANFANADMVGHTGVFDATVTAVEVIDGCLDRIAGATLGAGGALLITADHGNAEHKIDARDNSALTAHTLSPVPVILVGTEARVLAAGGGLQDVAPTVLEEMGLSVPSVMTGHSLAAPATDQRVQATHSTPSRR
ncbi:MAG: 2,3-bisphosphoglycerate-independent phosphoglycerate mutase [Candidatus Dormibacteraeota bacterium]|nr:2,3-bisphosphoglycerate-independent phosphoglycerate mutase [Candidatus Dormibacteraeota bacterium]